ncbi:TonB-dependent siderophore receptor [Bordetella genomosp. 11]|uniref:TonB-dependent siderophore receptor n=2 Tax=Bordetella genomosp. 11 TaxID=1416808 RepID=A0A261UIC8_9BORD|nr:TonB-dependent siderophore receptor [Bordetella genomosp. 11]
MRLAFTGLAAGSATMSASALAQSSGTTMSAPAPVQSPAAATPARAASGAVGSSTPVTTLAPVSVTGNAITEGDTLPPTYPGGQVAKGARLGVLGEQDAANVPFSVTSFTSQLVEDQQARTLGDVLRNDPSVQVTRGYGNDAQSFVIRGFPLYGDDISYGGLFGVMPRQIISPQGAERIEIFKGPSAFLNGVPATGSGVGGMVNIEPKRAGDDPLTRLSVDYGTSSQRGATADIGRRWGASNQFGIRVNALQREGDTGIDDDSTRMTFGSVGLDYRGERLRASLDVGYQKQRTSQGRPMVQVIGDDIPGPPSARHNYAQPWTYSMTENTFGMLRAEYDLTERWTAYAAIGGNHARESGSYSSLTVNGDGVGTGSRLDVPYVSDTYGMMSGVRGKFETGPLTHSVNAAFSSVYLKKRSAYTFGSSFATSLDDTPEVPSPPTILTGGNMDDPGVTGRNRMTGISVSDTVSFLDDRVFVTVGARHQKLRVTNYAYTGEVDSKYDDSATSPVYGLVVKPWQHVSLYANHIEGLQPGPTAPLTAINANTTFAPSKSKQNEIGAKLDMGSYGASLAFFEIKQPTGVTDPATQIFSVAGEQRNRGVELNVFGEPLRGVRVIGGVSVIDATLRDTKNPATEGNHAVGVPDYTAVLSTEWDLPWVPGLTLQGRVTHAGSQYLDTANTQKVKPWTTLDLGARYAMKIERHDVVWRLGVENVTNKRYWSSANGGYLIQGDPRTVKLSVAVDF